MNKRFELMCDLEEKYGDWHNVSPYNRDRDLCDVAERVLSDIDHRFWDRSKDDRFEAVCELIDKQLPELRAARREANQRNPRNEPKPLLNWNHHTNGLSISPEIRRPR
jgi:hypothetical protein